MIGRVLLVEDDLHLGAMVRTQLERAGYGVAWVRDGDAAIATSPADYDLVVLDLMLPGAYGLDVLKHVRRHSGVPVLILSARNETPDKVRALKLGADDYVTKPFWPEELMARVSARLRRPLLEEADTIHAGPFLLDVPGRRAQVDGRTCDLTRVEFDFLVALARRPGAAVARAELADSVLDSDRNGCERTLDVHASRLRKKLGERGRHVKTAWGIGYRLDIEPAA
jgi:two-component system response regulator MtrA